MGWKEPEFKSLKESVETLQKLQKEIEKQGNSALENLIFVLEGKKELDNELESESDRRTSPTGN